jgi:NADH:ubiquinone oxidoreductase subunit 6 (subunit J)
LDVDWEFLAFVVLSVFEVAGSILVVINKRLVRAAFWLALTLVTIGAIYVLFLSEFIFIIQILVYAGAVPVLVVFGIMLTRRRIMDEPGRGRVVMVREFTVVLAVAALFGVMAVSFLGPVAWPQSGVAIPVYDPSATSPRGIANSMFDSFSIAVILIAILLGSGMIGGVYLAKMDEPGKVGP